MRLFYGKNAFREAKKTSNSTPYIIHQQPRLGEL